MDVLATLISCLYLAIKVLSTMVSFSEKCRSYRRRTLIRKLRRLRKEQNAFTEYFALRNDFKRNIITAFNLQNELPCMLASLIHSSLRQRRFWVYPSTQEWWEIFVMQVWSDERWYANFRMSRALFLKLVEILRPEIAKKDTNMRRAICPEKRVAIAIWLLGHRSAYRGASNLFGVGKSTISKIFVEVVLAMEKLLLSKAVYPGDPKKIMDGFAEMGYPHVIGALDGCHINIVPPVRQGNNYINRKNTFSVLLQGVCDHTGLFRDVEIGWSGKVHDSRMLRNSIFFEAMEEGIYVPNNPTITVFGSTVVPLVLADAAYPIRKWLMTPYRGRLTPKKLLYNKRHNNSRNTIERAYGRLKSRWRCLSIPLEVAEENICSVIASCVILHNYCETKGAVLDEENYRSNDYVLYTLGAPQVNKESSKKKEGEKIRASLTEYFWWKQHGRR